MSRPKQECDLIMRGGITSGVVFPRAIVELGRRYRFRCIGGTSAGAIAAAFAAAAEHHGDEGFRRLGEIPEELAGSLRTLFQPDRRHRKVFDRLVRWLETSPGFWRAALWLLFHLRAVKRSFRALPETGFGFCPGTTQGDPRVEGLTDWLNRRLEWVAGTLDAPDDPLPDTPLTFGALQGDGDGVTLRMITTSVSQRRPYTLPIPDGFRIRRRDADALLPRNVVDWLWRGRDPGEDAPIPSGDEMPVILAVRMSLSFPLLFSAVCLQTRDFSRHRKGPAVRNEWMDCYFSDGGLSSNFPIHLFDGPIAMRPVFGISLEEFHDDRHEPDRDGPGDNRIYLPMGAGQGQTVHLHETSGLGSFLGGLLDAARNWQDSMLAQLPGYRERVVRIALKSEEGGLNLEMKTATIRDLTRLGELAARRLAGTSAVAGQNFDFEEHRYRRLLSATSAFNESLVTIAAGFEKDPEVDGTESLGAFLASYLQDFATPPVASYRPPRREDLESLARCWGILFRCAKEWTDEHLQLEESWNFPSPTPSLRFFPKEFVSPRAGGGDGG